MTDDVITWMDRQLTESELDDDAGLIVLAALEGDDELDASLHGNYSRPVTDDANAEAPDVNPVFLQSIQVEGFRGIGPQTRIDFQPGPGLTIVAGRNGSGKSSLAEALELTLTGETYRWKNRTEQWREQWRNVHHESAPRVAVSLFEQSHGPLTISTTWPEGATDVGTAAFRSQRKSEKQRDGLASLGWDGPLTRFRPILSYGELGGLLDGKPSALYDAIANVLGVEQVSDALKRVQGRLSGPKKADADLTKRRKALVVDAKNVDDERAAEAARALRSAEPALTTLRGLVSGTAAGGSDSELARLRSLSELPTDWLDATVAATADLRSAVSDLADAGGEFGQRRIQALELREKAEYLHEQFGDQDCPVCGVGRLDAAWAAQTAEADRAERAALASVTTAREALGKATARVRELQVRGWPSLAPVGVAELDAALLQAHATGERWHDAPETTDGRTATLLELADHLDTVAPELADTFDVVARAARTEYAARQQAWEPLAMQIAAWCGDWESHQTARAEIAVLARAEKWLKGNDLRLKNERIAPLRDHARHAWALLRQESNVEINDLVLEGAATRRRVMIDTTIDGTEAGSLAVLSQGEMHALALALFLPRATMAESPFRFVVLDDPVQAMDPAKVDGLVELLSELAQTRQVIVFSHDDRLPEAARRAQVGARIIEVVRGSDSVVTIRSAANPVTRYLGDARALIKDAGLPESALRRTLPGLLRFAVEAAARARYFRQQLQDGCRITDIEEEWQANHLTRSRLSLALYGEVRPNMDSWLDQQAGRKRRLALGIVGPGMHAGLKHDVDPEEAVVVVSRLVEDLRESG